MNGKDKMIVAVAGVALAMVAVGAFAKSGGSSCGNTSKQAASSVVTNDNGSISRTFSESTVTTNGNMVTEYRRETSTNLDMDGNVLGTSTSEYAQSYPVGDVGLGSLRDADDDSGDSAEEAPANVESFLGLKFGATLNATNFVIDAADPDFLRTTFTPSKPLAGFDDYYVYVTPKTRRVAKIYACARDAVEPGTRWRRHYLIEALEKRYHTWARLCSWCRPSYAFDVGGGKHITACLDGASVDYRTVIAAWDDELAAAAAEERDELREEARKTAAEKRRGRVKAAAEAF